MGDEHYGHNGHGRGAADAYWHNGDGGLRAAGALDVRAEQNFRAEATDVSGQTVVEREQIVLDAVRTGTVPSRDRLQAVAESHGDGIRAAYVSAMSGPHAQYRGLDAQDISNYENEYKGEGHDG